MRKATNMNTFQNHGWEWFKMRFQWKGNCSEGKGSDEMILSPAVTLIEDKSISLKEVYLYLFCF
jgi:hypothetical protein